MKAILVLICMWFLCHGAIAQAPPKSNIIKIDYATKGYDAPDSLYSKETCLDSKMKIVDLPVGPKFKKNVIDSIIVTYHFEFNSTKDTCFVSSKTLLEILDKNLNVVAQKTVYVTQFDTDVKYYLFFKDLSINSVDYFIQFKITTDTEDYVSTLAQLPHRFNK